MADPQRTPTILEQLESLEVEVAHALLEKIRLDYLRHYVPGRILGAVFTFINSFITIAILAGVAMTSGTPFIFPSLGPTAFMFFFNPTAPGASPRNTLCGHALGILCGYGSLWCVGLAHAESALIEGVNGFRILAVALSLALTGALMILLRVVHPPAGATTLIVSLGLVTGPYKLLVIEIAVLALTVQAYVINRLAGIDYPLWKPRKGTSRSAARGGPAEAGGAHAAAPPPGRER